MPNPAHQLPRLGAGFRPLRIAATFLAAVVAIDLLTACVPASPTAPLNFPFAKGWRATASGAPRLLDNAVWWQGLQDTTLDSLITRAVQANPDLAAARARVASALASAQAVPGAISTNGGGSVLATGRKSGTVSADLGLDVLFDPGGSRRANRQAAQANAELAIAQGAGARLLLIGHVAETYLVLRHDQRRLALSRGEASRQRQTLEMTRSLAKLGESTRIESLRSEARLASLDAARPAIEAAIAKDIAQLSILVGDAPGNLPPDLQAHLQSAAAQPRARIAPDLGIPADLIRNRPDLQAAQARYDSARAGLGQARAAFYPQLSLSGTIEVGRGLGPNGAGPQTAVSVGPSLRLPALPQGPARAAATAAESEITAAYADWTSAVLKALYEVEAALIDYRSAARAEAASDHALSLHAQARKLMREAAALGEVTLSDLISVEDGLSNAESAQADARLARALAFARLNQRLGAGAAPSAK